MPLYAFGSNGSGQLGIGHLDDVSTPIQCLFTDDEEQPDLSHTTNQTPTTIQDDQPIRIAAGGNHTLALFKSGAVYAAGSNENGRCGHDPSKVSSLLQFRRVVITAKDGNRRINRFKAVSATWAASFFVDAEQGHLYVCGVGMKGELGLGENYTDIPNAMRIPDFPPVGEEIVSISGSLSHTAVALSNGDVYGWGISRKGQLGEGGVKKKVLWQPTKIEGISFSACQVACGREFTVIAGEPDNGEFAILGFDKWDIVSGAPHGIKGYATLSASWHGVYVHQQDGVAIAWGRNDRGQLLPQNLPRPTKLGVGSEHVVAIIEDSKVVAFGWGEHGNCGPETDAQGNVAGKWNEIAFDGFGKITGVGAGCATSWIMTA
ncbi:hypothetical protein FQN52_009169 [Onygenales sp. PD_12]|nr:hypothetical protein FQN52_009169 [Onygenales sp. PD_12]